MYIDGANFGAGGQNQNLARNMSLYILKDNHAASRMLFFVVVFFFLERSFVTGLGIQCKCGGIFFSAHLLYNVKTNRNIFFPVSKITLPQNLCDLTCFCVHLKGRDIWFDSLDLNLVPVTYFNSK